MNYQYVITRLRQARYFIQSHTTLREKYYDQQTLEEMAEACDVLAEITRKLIDKSNHGETENG